jgi:hypothetical protein
MSRGVVFFEVGTGCRVGSVKRTEPTYTLRAFLCALQRPRGSSPESGRPGETLVPLADCVGAFRRCATQTAVARHGDTRASARELGLHRSNRHHLAGRIGLKSNAPPRRWRHWRPPLDYLPFPNFLLDSPRTEA